MAASGEANARTNSSEANLADGLDDSSQVQDHSALMLPVTIADMQRQIRENNALVHALREELRQSSLAKTSFGPSSPSLSKREPPENPTACIPEDRISLFAMESSVVGSHKRGGPFQFSHKRLPSCGTLLVTSTGGL